MSLKMIGHIVMQVADWLSSKLLIGCAVVQVADWLLELHSDDKELNLSYVGIMQ